VRFYHLVKENEVTVAAVEPGSPAERAGLKINDIIVAYGPQPVGAIDDLYRLLSEEQIDGTWSSRYSGEPIGCAFGSCRRSRTRASPRNARWCDRIR
jgi:hypothetical protein